MTDQLIVNKTSKMMILSLLSCQRQLKENFNHKTLDLMNFMRIP